MPTLAWASSIRKEKAFFKPHSFMASVSRQGTKNPCPFSTFSHGRRSKEYFIGFNNLASDFHNCDPHLWPLGLGHHIFLKILYVVQLFKLALKR
jgi:hypothetical protein